MRWNLLATTMLGGLMALSSAAVAQEGLPLGKPLQYNVPQAQTSPNPNTPVQSRARPEYDPLGLHRGSFYFFPSIDTSVSYDSNVNATKEDEKSDIVLTVTPQLALQSDWSRHMLAAQAYASGGLYLDQDQNNYLDYGVSTNGRYDISRASSLNGRLGYDRLHDSKGSSDDLFVGDADLVEYDRFVAGGGYGYRFNRFSAAANLLGRIYSYDDVKVAGTSVSQDYRDRTELGGTVRLGYQISPRFDLFTRGTYTHYDYDNLSPAGRNQDGDKYRVDFGTSVDFTAVLFGEASIGYVKQTYKDDDFDSTDGLSADVGLTWNVTSLTTLQLDVSRDYLPSSSGGQARLSTDATVSAHHELRRNIILNAAFSYENDDYEGQDRNDDLYSVGAGADWLINRMFVLNGQYEYTTRDSSISQLEYDRHTVMLRLRAQI